MTCGEGGWEAVEREEEACKSVGGETEGEVGERGVGKSGKREKQWGDTCMLVYTVLSSAVVWGASPPVGSSDCASILDSNAKQCSNQPFYVLGQCVCQFRNK